MYTMPLCAICEKFDIQLLRHYLDECIPIRYSTIKENSELGCEFCSLLLEGVCHHLDDFKAAAHESKDRSDADNPWIRITVDGKYETELGKTARCRKLHVVLCNHQYLTGKETAFDLSSTGEFYLVASQGE